MYVIINKLTFFVKSMYPIEVKNNYDFVIRSAKLISLFKGDDKY